MLADEELGVLAKVWAWTSWTSKVCKITACSTTFRGFGPRFYILFGSRSAHDLKLAKSGSGTWCGEQERQLPEGGRSGCEPRNE